MSNTFGTWLIGAGVAVVALLLLFGTPGSDGEAVAEPDVTEVIAADTTSGSSQPAAPSQTVSATTSSAGAVSTTYPAYGSTAGSTAQVTRVGGCGTPAAACANLPCVPNSRCSPCDTTVDTCRWAEVSTVYAPPAYDGELVGGCGTPAAACAAPICYPLVRPCYDACADPCRLVRPGINRNMPLCIDECSFVQLHSTVSHPICGQMCFQWSASKGRFLDPTASDPLYFAPTTLFCGGEDVWITLAITDASGAQYSDSVSLHVRDLW